MSDCHSTVMTGRDSTEVGNNMLMPSQFLSLGLSETLYIALPWPLVESEYKLTIEKGLPSLTGLDRDSVC